MADRETDLRARIATATHTLREYTGGDVHRHVCELMAALEESYKHDLITVDAGNLVRVQTALRQVVAIREAIQRGSIQEPKV